VNERKITRNGVLHEKAGQSLTLKAEGSRLGQPPTPTTCAKASAVKQSSKKDKSWDVTHWLLSY